MNELVKVFEGNEVIIEVINGEPMFEIYSTGMALGYVNYGKNKNNPLPHKSRIDNIISNADISTCVHGVNTFITESQLYDFMLEARTGKCKAFRKWVTDKVLPSIRQTGAYSVNQSKQSYLIQDPIERAYAWIEEEKQRQLLSGQVKALTPLAELAKERIDRTGLATVTDITRTFNFKVGQMTRWAKDNGYLHKTLSEVNKKGRDYFRVYETGEFKCIGVTEDGIKLIDSNKEEIINY